MRSWKTTVAGVGALLVVIGQALQGVFDNDPTTPNWSVLIPSAIAAIGLIFARDNDKSSEDVGIK